jgi:nickel transport protein
MNRLVNDLMNKLTNGQINTRGVITFVSGLMVLLSLVGFPTPTLAHSVQTDYRIEANALELQTTFSTGEAFGGAPVTVYAPNDSTRPWLRGTTDRQGNFSFQPDPTLVGEWSVEIGSVDEDHGDMLTVPVSERGVEIDAISQNPYDAPHKFARQVLVGGAVLGSVGAVGWLRSRR